MGGKHDGLTCKANQEIRDVEDVGWVPRGEVVHFVGFSALVCDDIDENVHRCVAILWRRAVSARVSAIDFLAIGDETNRTGTRRTTDLEPILPNTASSPSLFVRPYRLSGLGGAEGAYGGCEPSNT